MCLWTGCEGQSLGEGARAQVLIPSPPPPPCSLGLYPPLLCTEGSRHPLPLPGQLPGSRALWLPGHVPWGLVGFQEPPASSWGPLDFKDLKDIVGSLPSLPPAPPPRSPAAFVPQLLPRSASLGRQSTRSGSVHSSCPASQGPRRLISQPQAPAPEGDKRLRDRAGVLRPQLHPASQTQIHFPWAKEAAKGPADCQTFTKNLRGRKCII